MARGFISDELVLPVIFNDSYFWWLFIAFNYFQSPIRPIQAAACIVNVLESQLWQPWAGRIEEAHPKSDQNRDRDFKSSTPPTLFRVRGAKLSSKSRGGLPDFSRWIETDRELSGRVEESGKVIPCLSLTFFGDSVSPIFNNFSRDCRGCPLSFRYSRVRVPGR